MGCAVNVSTDYAWLSIILSVAALVMLGWHLPRTVRNYRLHHDDRAAVSLAVSVSVIVVAIGLLVSGLGLLLDEPEFSTAGLSISRSALIILAAVLVFADVRQAP
jgi:hypothetical protein